MPTIYVSLWDRYKEKEFLILMPYKKVGGKYLYGPEANGVRRRPEPVHVSPWQKVKDGYAEMFRMIFGRAT